MVLNLRDEAALGAGWDKLHASVAKARPGLALDGVLVEAMARPGVELILGARNDKDWGPVLVIGLGGVFAEHLHWSMIFWINVPLGLASLAMLLPKMGKIPTFHRRRKVDWLGGVLLMQQREAVEDRLGAARRRAPDQRARRDQSRRGRRRIAPVAGQGELRDAVGDGDADLGAGLMQ